MARSYAIAFEVSRPADYPARMIPLFLGLSIANMTALLLAVGLGYAGVSGGGGLRAWHMLSGAIAVLLCIAVHCVVFTYFIATAKWIQHAVTVKGLPDTYSSPTRSFKAQAFPAALCAMGSVFIAAMFGAATDNQMVSTTWHHLMALGALAVNLGAAVLEYAAIGRNGRLIDRILGEAAANDLISPA
jgi:hypothetical protein